MINYPAEEVGVVKRVFDKLVRKVTGKFEPVKQIEIDRTSTIYQLYFPELPEILKLGRDYDNRLEISVQSFRLEYWTSQLKGYFYSQVEQFINVMCSYEIAKMERFDSGYTDDPIHLLFHILKNWAVKLSNTHFDEEDIVEAKHWQSVIQDLLTQKVFKPSNEDSRIQVLFTLEEILGKEIIPRLIYCRENKSAVEQLKTVSSHLEKFYYHVIKYLFYIARDSKYVPNFSHVKLLSLSGDPAYPESFHLTKLEKDGWSSLKDTLPIRLLVRLVKTDLTMFTQMPPLSISGFDLTKKSKMLLKTNAFLNVRDEIKETFDHSLRKYAKHIDFRTYVNILVFMQELINFRQIFSAAQQCAEMGGNLLAFGLLRGQLTADINDCLQCLQLIMNHCEELEDRAWRAYKDAAFSSKDRELAYVSEDWQKNYSQSAKNYYRQMVNEHDHCKSELSQLAAAANKKTTEFLIEETKQKIQTYLALHEDHSSRRGSLLYEYRSLNTALENTRRIAYKPSTDPRQLYRDTKLFGNDVSIPDIGNNLITLANTRPSVVSLYYAAKFFNDINRPDIKEPRQKCLTDLFKLPGNELETCRIKAYYLQSQVYLEENKYQEAKETINIGLDLASRQGNHKYISRFNELNIKYLKAKEAVVHLPQMQ